MDTSLVDCASGYGLDGPSLFFFTFFSLYCDISPSFPVSPRAQSFISQRDRALILPFVHSLDPGFFFPFRESLADRIHILPIFHVHRIFSQSSCAIPPYDGPHSAITHMLTNPVRMLASHGRFLLTRSRTCKCDRPMTITMTMLTKRKTNKKIRHIAGGGSLNETRFV
jgi:hypothetical protein